MLLWSRFGRQITARMKDLQWIMTCSSRRCSIKESKPIIQQEQRLGNPEIQEEQLLSNTERTYEEAIEKLNDLQSNASVLHAARKNHDKFSHRNIPEATLFAKRAGVTVDRINKLPVIHVSGTKGKGSACAFCESILRNHGLKTGFYSSPHLVEVRERIRINGLPLEKGDFVRSFFEVYDRLQETKLDHDNAMPAYFRFLTIMALHIFLKENVDVALIEVGIGGQYDCTNIIREPTVVGITSLGMDHQSILGDTLAGIAWHKTGICKPGKPAFTVPQPEEAMKVVLDRAHQIGSPIQCVSPIENNCFGAHPIQLGLAGDHQKINASLAVHLCRKFLETRRSERFKVIPTNGPTTRKRVKVEESAFEDETVTLAQRLGMSITEPIVLPESFISGLRDCYWAGRNQFFQRDRVTYYIDGAHTVRSIEACRRWFLQETDQESMETSGSLARILIFNSTGKRDSLSFLKILLDCQFDGIVFCPNVISAYNDAQNPLDNGLIHDKSRQVCQSEHYDVGSDPSPSARNKVVPLMSPKREDLTYKHHSGRSPLSRLHQLKQEFEELEGGAMCLRQVNGHCSTTAPVPTVVTRTKCVVVPSITDALQWAACAKDSNLSSPRSEDPTPPEGAISAERIQVLVTGSIHLVGGVIKVLDPELVIHK